MLRKIIILATIFVGVWHLSFCQSLDLKGLADKQNDRSLNVSGNAMSSGMSKVAEQIKQIKSAQERASQQMRLLQYVPLDGQIDPTGYIVGPNDLVSVKAWGASSIDQEITITPDGMAVVDGFGAIPVAGLSWKDAKVKIESAIKEISNPEHYSVTLTGVRIFIAHVAGAVTIPGSFQCNPTQRVWDIIQLAGGNTPMGDISNVVVVERNGDSIFCNISDYLSTGNLAANPYLKEGEVVVVKTVSSRFGLVKLYGGGTRSGFYGLNPNETVSTLVARSNITNIGSPELSTIRVMRGDKIINVDLFKDDLLLENGDKVIVPSQLDSVMVGGLVANGGAFPFYPKMAFQGYIALANGPTEKGSLGRVSIYRQNEELSPEEAGDIIPGDIIMVHISYFQQTKDFISTVAQVISTTMTVYLLIERINN
jgi:protein involved in polysaccharide export with SLBB domain